MVLTNTGSSIAQASWIIVEAATLSIMVFKSLQSIHLPTEQTIMSSKIHGEPAGESKEKWDWTGT